MAIECRNGSQHCKHIPWVWVHFLQPCFSHSGIGGRDLEGEYHSSPANSETRCTRKTCIP